MKKLVVFVLVAVSLFSVVVALVICNNNDKEAEHTTWYAYHKKYYNECLTKDTKELANYLYGIDELDEFVDVNSEDRDDICEKAALLFDKDEATRQRALKAAKEYIDWQGSLTDEDIQNMVDEQLYRARYIARLEEKPEALAKFLLDSGELDDFVIVDAKDHSKAIEDAVTIFGRNEDIRQLALKRAKEIYAETNIDCNWAEIRKIEKEGIPYAKPAINAETGEPISSEPAGPWAGPTD